MTGIRKHLANYSLAISQTTITRVMVVFSRLSA
jgi:hypothetical protein